MQRYWRQNCGVRYLLTVIDVLSKYAWVRPIKRKTGAKLLKAFESIVAEGRRPQMLQTDKGKEFYNTTLQRWLKKECIHHFSTLGDAKASIVERFNRTLKSQLYRYFTAANTTQYLDILPSLVQQYVQGRDGEERSRDMATIVRASHQDPTTGAIESGRQSATERTRQDVQERLLTAMDRRSV